MRLFKTLLITLLLPCLNVQGQINPLTAASRAANRLISDASFELTEANQRGFPFPVVMDCERYGLGDIVTAEGVITATVDSVYLIGINSSGTVGVYVNGQLISNVQASSSPFPSEIAYNNYLFEHYHPVTLHKGENKIEIKSAAKVSFGIVDEEGFAESDVTYQIKKYRTPTGEFTPEVIREYRLFVQEDAAFTNHPYTEWHYANGTTIFGLMALAEATSNQKYSDFAQEYSRFSVENLPLFTKQYYQNNSLRGQNFRMFRSTMLDDTSAPALPLIIQYANEGGSAEKRELIDRMVHFVMHEQPRLTDGTFARPEPKWTIWADDLFMSSPFLLYYARLTGDNRYFDEVAKQIINFDKYLYDPQTGLYYHGWNDTKKEYAGLLWGRANGWLAWGISEALLNIPKTHPQYQTILDIHRRQLKALARYQNEDGLWHQLLDTPASFTETTATAIFTMAIARAVMCGWIDEKHADNAIRGWAALEKRIDADGIVSGITASTPILYTAEQYKNQSVRPNDPRGMGAVFMAAVEVDRLMNFMGITQTERRIYNDPITDNEVWQITNHHSISNVPYFYTQAFTTDDAWVVFKSNRDGDVWKIFRSNMTTGEVSKVSDKEVRSGYTIMPDGKRVAFLSGNTIYAIDVATLEAESIYSFEPTEDLVRFSALFSADGKYTILHFYNEETGTRVFRINVLENKSEQVFATQTRITHILLNPRHPHLFAFVPQPDTQDNYELSLEERARYHLFDINTGIAKPFVMTPIYHRATHGSWGADGERFYFYRKYRGTGARSVTICSLNKNGTDLREHFHSSEFRLGHGVADATQSWFITDSQDPIENPLMKIDLITGEAVILCWANSLQTSTTNDQTDHVHPVISASGRFVAFTSDVNSRGLPQMFVIPMP
jgi:rhamnogalacturonyl hydrolase YesR